MYNYYPTHVINSATDPNGSIPRFTGTADRFSVTRIVSIDSDNILSANYTPYAAPVMEVATFTVPTFDTTTLSSINFTLRVGWIGSQFSAYARNRTDFERDFPISINPTGVAATDAAAIAALLNGLKVSSDIGRIKVTVNGAVLTFTASSGHQKLRGIYLEGTYLDTAAQYWGYSSSKILDTSGFAVTTTGSVGMGNDEWMQTTAKVPTLDNAAPFGLGVDSRPISGGNYSAFYISFKVPRDWDTGFNNNGSYETVSHTFYVASSITAQFKAALLTTYPGLSIRSNTALTTLATTVNGTAATTVSLVVNHTAQVGASTINTVSYVSSNTAVATVDNEGLVTAIAAGTATITVTDIPADNSGTVTVTVTTS